MTIKEQRHSLYKIKKKKPNSLTFTLTKFAVTKVNIANIFVAVTNYTN